MSFTQITGSECIKKWFNQGRRVTASPLEFKLVDFQTRDLRNHDQNVRPKEVGKQRVIYCGLLCCAVLACKNMIVPFDFAETAV